METQRDIDPAALQRVYALGGALLVRRLLGLVLETAPRRAREAASCARSGDLAGTAFAAHALRSTAGNAGALRVSSLAGLLEREARAGHADQALHLADDLELAAADMEHSLKELAEAAS